MSKILKLSDESNANANDESSIYANDDVLNE
jgi:hypothetical protein